MTPGTWSKTGSWRSSRLSHPALVAITQMVRSRNQYSVKRPAKQHKYEELSLVCELSGRVHTRVVRMAGGGVMLGSERNPAVLRHRDGADDENSRRVVEGDGEEDHLVGGGRDHRGDGSDDASLAGAHGDRWLRGTGRPPQGKAERSAGSGGYGREGIGPVPGDLLRPEHSPLSRKAAGGACHRAELHVGAKGATRRRAGGEASQAGTTPAAAAAAAAAWDDVAH